MPVAGCAPSCMPMITVFNNQPLYVASFMVAPREKLPTKKFALQAVVPTSEAHHGLLPTSEAVAVVPTSEAHGFLPTSEAVAEDIINNPFYDSNVFEKKEDEAPSHRSNPSEDSVDDWVLTAVCVED
jgi:hypothetical protein